jgi:dihydrofolate reductase
MAKLIYSTIASLDCFVEDSEGAIEWGAPTDELAAFINDLERPIGTYLYGRRMYETMVFWEGNDALFSESIEREFAEIWRAATKIVYSTTLAATSSSRTHIERVFDEGSILHLKATSPHDITIAGANLASTAFRVGLIDEVQLFQLPLILGAGKPAFPLDQHVTLELLEERRFANGQKYVRYAVVK